MLIKKRIIVGRKEGAEHAEGSIITFVDCKTARLQDCLDAPPSLFRFVNLL
jgi:hypothetical protein